MFIGLPTKPVNTYLMKAYRLLEKIFKKKQKKCKKNHFFFKKSLDKVKNSHLINVSRIFISLKIL